MKYININSDLIFKLGFSPKDNEVDVFIKKYQLHDNYYIEVDFDKEMINYGNLIMSESKTTQNFSQSENWVVLECVDRLLNKGYKPQNITLEKTWGAGHGTSGRLDICVTREDGSEYLLIECKTYGKEFDKEFSRMRKDGGQLFTYFKFSNKPDVIMLYASKLESKGIVYENEIVKIEDDYRTGDVKDFYKTWDKKTYQNIFWENLPYNTDARPGFTKKDLKELDEQGSKKIFNEFASILRKHSVSDKPNAFNKIFNLFLAKLYDEAKKESDELEFHWREDDNAVDFQVRLINLHKYGLRDFLQKEIEGIQDADFGVITSQEELQEKKKKILKFNNVFAIKDVLDDDSFDENQRVLKDVVQLLEKYQIRYPRKQQHLSDFFELLLTTGLKQEVGQYFTPPPITKFIMRSLPIQQMIERDVNKEAPELPAIIDYAAGSGHFITEAMEGYQDIINNFTKDKTEDFYPKAKKQIASWQADPYEWAAKYVYGIEKDYRLVKVAKVGCYFYGDGVAQIIHGDGLDNFVTSKTYKGLLKENTNLEDSTKAKFSLVLSNPPYSVNDCKDDLEYIGAQDIFTLYPSLSDKSKDIECLFVERTKHLLKDDGIAAVILPSSILNNTGIQTKTREIILQNFDIVAIAELGGNTFMATNTNTVTLFLKRRNNQIGIKFKSFVANFLAEYIDKTIEGIERPVAKYVNYVWEGISYDDYISLLQNKPNQRVENSELYKEYRKKIKAKADKEFWSTILERESEKLYYFLLTYPQKVVLVKSGEKDAEKRFLGYEFSNRRGSEGIHPTQRGKAIDECTKLFDVKVFDNPEKASTYIYKAFTGDTDSVIDESMRENVSRANLVDMLTFDRVDFEKNISLSAKKKVRFENIWLTDNLVALSDIADIRKGTSITKEKTINGEIPVVAGGQDIAYYHNVANREGDVITISASGAYSGFVNYFTTPIFASDCNTVQSRDESIVSTKLLYLFLKSIQSEIYGFQKGQAQPHVYGDDIAKIKIPLPPKDIQAKIVAEIEKIEESENKAIQKIMTLKSSIDGVCDSMRSKYMTKKLIQIAQTNPSKSEIKGLEDNMIVSFVGMAAVSNDGFITHQENRPYSQIKKGSYTYFKRGDIVVAKITPCMENGKCAMTENLDNEIGLGSSEFHVLRAQKEVASKYLFTLLNRKSIRIEAEKNMTGASGHRRVPISFYEQLDIPLPSLAEQQNIVGGIEILEKQIVEAQKIIDGGTELKNAVLKKYL